MTNQLSVTESVDRDLSAIDLVLAYHERTKHHLHRYAAALGYMDWATQPNPFRRYEGASLIELPRQSHANALNAQHSECWPGRAIQHW